MEYSIVRMRICSLVVAGFFLLMGSYYSLAQKTAAGWVYAYSFDGNAYDIGPNRVHGQIEGGVIATTDRFGRSGKALSFNGVDGFVRIPFGAERNLATSNFTFTIWLYVDKFTSSPQWDVLNSSNYSPIFCKTETDPHFQFRFGASDKGFYFDGGEEGASKGLYTKNGISLIAGKWNMVAVAFNGYVAKYYLNGKLIACENINAAFVQNNQPLIVGCDFPGQASYFSGKMDDFNIWQKFISEEEVREIYAVQSKYPFVPPNITVPPVVAKVDTVVTKTTPPAGVVDTAVSTVKPVVAVVDSSSKTPTVKPVQKAVKDESVFEVKKGNKIVLKHVLFVQSKAELLPESYAELDRLVATLNQNPNVIIEVSGHTDNQGNRDLNLKLSEERANKVKDYLVSRGIDPKRINVNGYGPDKPISPNDTETHRRLNRRVEFEIIQM
jgi:outer membrane protein OmpA-like peptidoglycan-associated protein